MFKSNKGFTLTETLTVLALIGAISAITMPILYNSQTEVQRMAAFKKMYNKMNVNIQKILSTQDQNQATVCETISCLRIYGTGVDTAGENLANGEHNGVFADPNKIDILSKCADCMTHSYIEPADPSDPDATPKKITEPNGDLPEGFDISPANFTTYILADNTIMAIQDFEGNCETIDESITSKNTYDLYDAFGNPTGERTTATEPVPLCGIILFDVNGKKSPNTAGKDRFAFYLADKSVAGSYLIPMGSQKDDLTAVTNTDFDSTATVIDNNWSYSRR